MSGGLFFTVMAVLLFLSRVTIGKLADKRGEALFVYSCNGLMLAALLLLALVPGNVTFLIAAALSGYAFGGIEPALQSMAVHTAAPIGEALPTPPFCVPMISESASAAVWPAC